MTFDGGWWLLVWSAGSLLYHYTGRRERRDSGGANLSSPPATAFQHSSVSSPHFPSSPLNINSQVLLISSDHAKHTRHQTIHVTDHRSQIHDIRPFLILLGDYTELDFYFKI